MNAQTALLDVRRMSEADRLAVAVGISAIELMANAGKAVVGAVLERWSPRPVATLCGPGNNGGDGFVTARLLAEAGWPVQVAMLGSRDRLTGAARHHADLWRGAIAPLTPTAVEGAELVVDAIFGAGLSRALEGEAKATLAAAASNGIPIVAVDVPSGVMGDTGETLGAVAAVLTVTFFRKKPGHLLVPGRLLCGELVVAEIGIPPSVLGQLAPDTFENDPGLWLSALPPRLGGLPLLLDSDTLSTTNDEAGAVDKAYIRTSILIVHEEELRRMVETSGDTLSRSRAAARRSDAVIVFNGDDTIIAAPDGRAIINAQALPLLDNDGAGKVLRTIMRRLLAQGMEPILAAAAVVWLHGAVAGDWGQALTEERLRGALDAVLRRLQK